MASDAQKSFELENKVDVLSPQDEVYKHDPAQQKRIRDAAPWTKDPKFFRRAKVSAVALIKMVTHARSGGAIEVMGLMQGKITEEGDIIVMDAFALPVEGTETRVNAGAEAYEYMIQYDESSKSVARPENVVGWYHSHPGYGCWLSGIDVGTQKENQLYQDPFLAVVIDPNRTISAGAVEIGAFRTFPPGHEKQNVGDSQEYQNIPIGKIEDFGVHASAYYALEVSHFKSSLDSKLLEALWNRYWVTTLSQSSLVTNRAYTTERMLDLGYKIKKHNKDTSKGRNFGAGRAANYSLSMSPSRSALTQDGPGEGAKPRKQMSTLDRLHRDMEDLSHEESLGLMTQDLKKKLFNTDLGYV